MLRGHEAAALQFSLARSPPEICVRGGGPPVQLMICSSRKDTLYIRVGPSSQDCRNSDSKFRKALPIHLLFSMSEWLDLIRAPHCGCPDWRNMLLRTIRPAPLKRSKSHIDTLFPPTILPLVKCIRYTLTPPHGLRPALVRS